MNPAVGKVMSRMQAAVYRLTGGRLGGRFGQAQALLLATTGRRSGQRRETPLFGVASARGWAIVASNSGHDKAPDWYYNLMSNPVATVRARRHTYEVTARVVEGDERKDLWDRLVGVYKDYNAYQEVTGPDVARYCSRERCWLIAAAPTVQRSTPRPQFKTIGSVVG